jgi:adenylate cyclase
MGAPPAGATGGSSRPPAHIITWDLRIWDTLANVVGAMIVFVLLAVIDAEDRVPADRRAEIAVLAALVVVIGTLVATFVLARKSRPLVDALDAGEPIEGLARRTLFAIPWYCAGVSVALWMVGSVLCVLESYVRLGNTLVQSIEFAGVAALGGLTTGLVVYITSERHLRPLVTEAFAHEDPIHSEVLSARVRLVMAWALGSAVPMVAVALLLLDPGRSGRNRTAALVCLALGVAIGGFTMRRAAHALIEPIEELRTAQEQVHHGDLGARCAVDDASEVGLLQAGFNEMVAGLEERALVRDLFGRHVGRDVARLAVEGDAALGGEIVDASALFVDVAGSTALSSDMSFEDLVGLLNDLFAAVVQAADMHGGWLNKFEGDAALCVFGPPLGNDLHASSALQAACELREAVRRLQRQHPVLDVGIGVSCGKVFAGNVGAEERYEYTIIGDPVNEAARLSELAKKVPGRLLVSRCTIQAAGPDGAPGWEAVGGQLLRGRPDLTELWAPTA